MLNTDNKLKAKTIKGRRSRSSGFLMALIAFVIFLAAALLFAFSITPTDYEGRGVIIFLFCVLIAGIPLAILWGLRKTTCVLTEDKLYFFGCDVTIFKSAKRKSNRHTVGNGYLLYSDITDLEYQSSHIVHRRIEGACIKIMGEDFCVILDAPKRFMEAINERRPKYRSDIPTAAYTESATEYPEGLWGQLLSAFDRDGLDRDWGEGVVLLSCEYREDTEVFDLVFKREGQEICFNIDESSIFVFYCKTQTHEDRPLTYDSFRDIDSVFSYMSNRLQKDRPDEN